MKILRISLKWEAIENGVKCGIYYILKVPSESEVHELYTDEEENEPACYGTLRECKQIASELLLAQIAQITLIDDREWRTVIEN
jgi:hypothetical protein